MRGNILAVYTIRMSERERRDRGDRRENFNIFSWNLSGDIWLQGAKRLMGDRVTGKIFSVAVMSERELVSRKY